MKDIIIESHFSELSIEANKHAFNLTLDHNRDNVLILQTPWDSYVVLVRENWPDRMRQQIKYQASKLPNHMRNA